MKNNRRDFLKNMLLTSGALVVGFKTMAAENAQIIDLNSLGDELLSNAFLTIDSQNVITIFSPNPEIGQGIKTAFAVIVAEELDVDWEKVVVKQADLDTKRFERQLTGGSGAIKHSWERLRKAGAAGKYALVQAAAKKWNVSANSLKTEKGKVINEKGESLTYGELVNLAVGVTLPADIPLKSTKDFTLIGKTIKSVDNKAVLTGKAIFGMDYKVPGMLYAQVIRSKSFGQKLVDFDASEALKIDGIISVKSFGDKIAVIGKSNWPIMKARKLVKINWSAEKELESDEMHNRIFSDLMVNGKFETRRKDGDVEQAFKDAHKIIEAEYQCPFLSHSPMEPMNFFADVKSDSVKLVGPTQTPQSAQNQVSKLLNIPVENITVDLTKMGGGFGRRLNNDYALEAAEVSALAKAPIKLQWTREDDMNGGIYRPAVRYKFKASLDKAGNVTGFMLKGVGLNAGNSTRQDNFPVGAIDNVLVESVDYKSDITTGPWRAPITNFLAYAEQAFIDEIAFAVGKDPVKLRLELLKKAQEMPVGKITYEPARFEKVITTVAERAKWGNAKKGIHQGFSVYFSHNSYVAQIAEVELKKGKPSLKKVFAVTDCGIVINQSGARNQIYGAIVDGLGHAMYGNLNFENGAPKQTNFDQYRMIKFNEVPEIDAYFVDNGIDPTGLGEPALPPTGGALANAIFKATGKRLYKQPFAMEDEKVAEIL
ncbi:xanthine dehydrogenase family protein molybdopterin-binding subunit [Lacihabitans sp. LS3-19]|uniref:xanthine dehydrogenase family protein molybdopterin-binding subunit n=1 Tax=Lacihabitans sp. LS3-19 TaxID=2487335 RepID=UPI0020CDCD8D|nr:molybdopterin cofactor-binding domain-containing protein [Lacihabitans sp. LS3-19]MCP9767533.1 xanthine dehydrogenase family protein molybdopterin-binding subunit [Lacihabitans sp. LS3-19]